MPLIWDGPGALQQRWNVPASIAVRLPADLDLRTAALVEPVAVAVHDVRSRRRRGGHHRGQRPATPRRRGRCNGTGPGPHLRGVRGGLRRPGGRTRAGRRTRRVYWNTGGTASSGTARVLQWDDTSTADRRWTLVANSDGSCRIRNVNSGKLLSILNASSTWGTQVVQDADNGSADNNWRLIQIG